MYENGVKKVKIESNETTDTMKHLSLLARDESNITAYVKENFFLLIFGGQGLNLDLSDCKPARYQLSHLACFQSQNIQFTIYKPFI